MNQNTGYTSSDFDIKSFQDFLGFRVIKGH